MFKTVAQGLCIGLGAHGHEQCHRHTAGQRHGTANQPLQVSLGLRHATSAEQEHSAAAVQGRWQRLDLKAIHHRIARRKGAHALALQASGREPITHGHQLTTARAHQAPFPGIPLTAFEPVVAVAFGPSGTAEPGVVAFGSADEAEGGTTAPGHQQRQQITHGNDGLALMSQAAYQLPLTPAQAGESSPDVCQQTSQALVAEATTGQGRFWPQACQPSLLNSSIKHPSGTHQRKHGQGASRCAPMHGLDDPQGDQVFAVAVAEKQQRARGMADTIP